MKLSKIYSNHPEVFQPICFVDGVNIILGENKHPEIDKVDAHNLGKTTLLHLLDFCFLKKKSADMFLLKAGDSFSGYVFYLELQLQRGKFLTIRRSVDNLTRISFLVGETGNNDYSNTPAKQWTHWEEGYDKSRILLTSYLEWDIPFGCSYRNMMMYFMRKQDDYGDAVELQSYIQSPSIWKAVLAYWLGLDGGVIRKLKDAKDELATLTDQKKILKEYLPETESSSLESIKEDIRTMEITLSQKQEEVENLNYFHSDLALISNIVEKIDKKLSARKARLYEIKSEKRRFETSLHRRNVNVDDEALFAFFEEIEILFPNAVKKSFSDLVRFNQAIVTERRRYLNAALKELGQDEKKCVDEIEKLEKERSHNLALMQSADTKEQLNALFCDIFALHERLALLRLKCEKRESLASVSRDYEEKQKEEATLENQLSTMLKSAHLDENSIFKRVSCYFSQIIMEVLGRRASIDVWQNKSGGLEFKAEYADAEGNDTSESDGNSYKKMLCIAFDMAIMNAWADADAPHFMFHDGIFEALDDTKKMALMRKIGSCCSHGMQHIITMIDSDIPHDMSLDDFITDKGKVVLTLKAGDDNGLLFKNKRW